MKKRFGFTLAEVMVAVAIFGFALLGVFSIGRLMHRSAMSNVADGIALHAVEGMMEQIRSMPYDAMLSPAAQDGTGTRSVDFIRYQSATTAGVVAGPVNQKIYINTTGSNAGAYEYTDVNGVKRVTTVNKDGYMAVDGINLSTQLTSTFVVQNQSPMVFEVRVVMTPKDANFASGIAVELFYRYKTNPSDDYKNHVMRTFIPRFIR